MNVQGIYPNFKKHMAEKKVLSSHKSAKAIRCLANAVSEQQASKSWQLREK